MRRGSLHIDHRYLVHTTAMEEPEPRYFGIEVTAPTDSYHPFPTSVNVRLNTFSRDRRGSILIGASLVTAAEGDHLVDSLIREIESARTEASRKLRR